DSSYLDYKLMRERYLNQHSSFDWPQLEVLFCRVRESSVDLQLESVPGDDAGYVIFEQGGKTLRILELVGSSQSIKDIWRGLVPVIRQRNIERVRGWEANQPDFAPDMLIDRPWAVPMLHSLTRKVDHWLQYSPCPLLELDHF